METGNQSTDEEQAGAIRNYSSGDTPIGDMSENESEGPYGGIPQRNDGLFIDETSLGGDNASRDEKGGGDSVVAGRGGGLKVRERGVSDGDVSESEMWWGRPLTSRAVKSALGNGSADGPHRHNPNSRMVQHQGISPIFTDSGGSCGGRSMCLDLPKSRELTAEKSSCKPTYAMCDSRDRRPHHAVRKERALAFSSKCASGKYWMGGGAVFRIVGEGPKPKGLEIGPHPCARDEKGGGVGMAEFRILQAEYSQRAAKVGARYRNGQ